MPSPLALALCALIVALYGVATLAAWVRLDPRCVRLAALPAVAPAPRRRLRLRVLTVPVDARTQAALDTLRANHPDAGAATLVRAALVTQARAELGAYAPRSLTVRQ
jgi:hypothetical protein